MTREDVHKNRWRFYQQSEEELIEFDKYLPIDSGQLNIKSPKLIKLLVDCCIQIDGLFKHECVEQKIIANVGEQTNMNQYMECFPNLSQAGEVIIKRGMIKVNPFIKWGVDPPIWWTKYNKIKHRNMIEYWKEVEYLDAINAISALLIINFQIEVGRNKDFNNHLGENAHNVFVGYPIYTDHFGHTIRTLFFMYGINRTGNAFYPSPNLPLSL